jgi:hypothetical protein
MSRSLIVKFMAAAVVTVSALSTPNRAEAASFCKTCIAGESCGLSAPEWILFCNLSSCSGSTYSCTRDWVACPEGYLSIDCNYYED